MRTIKISIILTFFINSIHAAPAEFLDHKSNVVKKISFLSKSENLPSLGDIALSGLFTIFFTGIAGKLYIEARDNNRDYDQKEVRKAIFYSSGVASLILSFYHFKWGLDKIEKRNKNNKSQIKKLNPLPLTKLS